MNKKNLKEYRIWKAMKSRCYSPSQANSYYQKEGIKVCDEWLHDFNKFLQDMGPIPSQEHSIERKDIKLGYCKENCEWIHIKKQSLNRRNSRMYTHDGQTHCLKEWSRILGINYDTLRSRVIKNGIPFEIAIIQSNFDKRVEMNGELHTVSEWCRILGLNAGDVFSRIHRGWDKEKALTTPIKSMKI